MLEKRIAELENTLATSSIIDEKNIDSSKAYLLSTVEIKNHNVGKTMNYTLVSKDEADFSSGKISVDSPIGAALLGKEVGDIIEVKVPAGNLKLEISFMNVILVANIAFAAYFVSSELRSSITIIGLPLRTKG